MILIDGAVGSKQLAAPLQRLGLPAEIAHLESGDVQFLGRGPQHATVKIGIEVKSVGDVLDCITSGRFSAQQLYGLADDYDYAWLAVYGLTKCGRDGVLETRRHPGSPWRAHRRYRSRAGGWLYRDYQAWLLTIDLKTPVRVIQVPTEHELIRWIATSYLWWTAKAWHEHQAHRALYQDQPGDGGRDGGRGGGRDGAREDGRPDPDAMLRELWSTRQDPKTLKRRLAKELPLIGWERSIAVDRHFPTVRDLALALAFPDPDDWTPIDGIGKTTAGRIVASLDGRDGRDGSGKG